MYGVKSLVATICDRTDVLSSSQEDLEVLGEGQPPITEVDLKVVNIMAAINIFGLPW